MAIQSNLLWLVTASLPVLLLLIYQSRTQQSIPPLSSADRSKVAVVFAGIAHYSHLEKAQPLAAGLVQAGYPVTFVTGEEFRNFSLATGAHFEPLDGPHGMVTDEEMADFFRNPGDGESGLASIIFMGHISEHLVTLQRVFMQLRSKYDSIVYIHDISFLALAPVQLGAPGILPTVSFGLGVMNVAVDSRDAYPFQDARVPDTTDNARRLHLQSYHTIKNPIRLAFDKFWATKLKELGAVEPYPSFYHSFGGIDDYLVQFGVPEFEYQRNDMATKLRFLGIPERPGGSRELPLWWQDILDAKVAGKKIIVVSQGSASFDLNHLLIPTVKAMADREDVLVVGTTVTQVPEIEGLTVPSNARLAQFIPYDLLLPQASLLVSTGGYGTVLQSIKAGVPMVLAGLLQDKAHVATLAEHVGVAINLRTDQPSTEALKNGIEKILGNNTTSGDSSYRANSLRIQQANMKYKPVEILDATILEAVSERKMRRERFAS